MFASGNCYQIKRRSKDFLSRTEVSLFPRSSDSVQEPQLVSSAALAEMPGCGIETFISVSSAIFYFFTLVCPFIYIPLHFWPCLVTGQHKEMGRGGSRRCWPGCPHTKNLQHQNILYPVYSWLTHLQRGESQIYEVRDKVMSILYFSKAR